MKPKGKTNINISIANDGEEVRVSEHVIEGRDEDSPFNQAPINLVFSNSTSSRDDRARRGRSLGKEKTRPKGRVRERLEGRGGM